MSFSLEYISSLFIKEAGRNSRDCNALPPLPQLYQDMVTQLLHHNGTAIYDYFLIMESQNDRRIQVGRNIRRSVV